MFPPAGGPNPVQGQPVCSSWGGSGHRLLVSSDIWRRHSYAGVSWEQMSYYWGVWSDCFEAAGIPSGVTGQAVL